MIYLPLFAIPISFLTLFLNRHRILYSILVALLLCIVDFYLKSHNRRLDDFEGFGLENLILLVSYIVSGLIFAFISIFKTNYKKTLVLIFVFTLVGIGDFYLFGMYKATIYCKKSSSVEESIHNNVFSREYFPKGYSLVVGTDEESINSNALNREYFPKGYSLIVGTDTLLIKNIWSQNQKIIKYGIGNKRDTIYLKDRYIGISIKKTINIYKIYCNPKDLIFESYGKYSNEENGYDTYFINISDGTKDSDCLNFKICKDSDCVEFEALKFELKQQKLL